MAQRISQRRLVGVEPTTSAALITKQIAATPAQAPEGRQASGALMESDERFRALFDTILEGFAYCEMLYDEDGRPVDWVYLAVNPAFGALTGLTDIVGQRVTEAIPGIAAASPELFDIYGRVASTGDSERFEINFTPLSKWLDVAVSSPSEGYFVAVFEDITERKQMEENLRLARFSIDHAAELVYWVDKAGRVVDVGASTALRLGFSREELRAMTIFDFTVGLTAEVWPELWESGKSGSYVVERELKTKSGETFPVALSVSYLAEEGREYHCIFAHDISERQAQDAKIRHLSSFPESNPSPVLEFDREGRLLYANPAAKTEAKRLGVSDMRRFLPLDDQELRLLTNKSTGSHFCRELALGDRVFAQTISYLPEFGSLRVFASDVSDRRATEEKLLLTQFSIDHSEDLIHWVDSDGRFLYVNDSSCRRLGYTREELLGMTVYDIDPSVPKPWPRHFQDTRELGSVTFESSHRTKGGDWYPVDVTIDHLCFGDQEYVCATARDITERKKAEEALRHSHDLMRYIIEHSRSAIAVHDKDLKYIYVSQRYLEERHLKEEEVIGRHHYDVLPYVPQKWRLVHQRALAGELLSAEDDPVVRADGTLDWTRWECRPWYEADGSIGGIVIGTEMITERKRAEEALRLTQLSVDSAMDMVAWIGTDGRLLYVNDSFCRRHGFSRDELLGMTIFDLDPEMSPGEWPEQWRREKKQGSTTFEVVHITKDREAFALEVMSHFMELDGREINVGFGRDITERKKAAEALKASEEQLRQSQKMEAVGQLAGGIAHDFNNLLTAILGYADLLLGGEGLASSPIRNDVEEIKHAAERASALTRQILAFSRRQALRPEMVSLNEVMETMERLLHRTLGENIDLVALLNPELGLVEVDPHQMQQVLMNLAVNARDAMPGGGKLTLETANVELDQEYCRTHPGTLPGLFVMLAVSDTGVGMDEQTKSHAFDPFFTTKEPGKGTGLGLSTVYGVVKQSGGSIFIYSEPGKGTSFKIYLPRADEPTKRRSGVHRLPDSLAGSETVLVVEDEAAVRELVRRVLEGLGYTVLTAASGDEALATLQESRDKLDLLLTDVVLPGGLQGHELVRAVAAVRPRLPVLYMSGYTRSAIVHSGRLDKGVDYLEKPFTPNRLARRIREVLDSRVPLN